ncbi:MAG: hypothetical protein QXD97_06490, partial [Acidilobaceae archaeon]
RTTLAWIRCSICGRRQQTIECQVGKRRLNLCIYCITALKPECTQTTQEIRPKRVEPDTKLIEEIEKKRKGKTK